MSQDLDAIRGHNDVVLDPNAAEPLDIDARLYGPDLPHGQDVIARPAKTARIVHDPTQAMSQAVPEVLREPLFIENLAGNRIAFIDFGMMGRLTDERRDELAQLLFGLVQNDSSLVADILMDWTGSGPMDETRLIQEIQSFVEQYRGVPLKRLDLGTMLADLAGLLRQNQLALPPDLAMLMKAFISLEGMGRELDPEFDMAGVALPVLEQVIRRRNQPRAIIQRGWKTGSAMLSLLSSLPGDLSRLLRAARRGRMEVHIDVIHLRRVGDQLDRAANRITIGIVVAALIIGSAIVLTVPGGPTLFGVSFLGLIGFSAATLGGVWLLLSIWRTRKQD